MSTRPHGNHTPIRHTLRTLLPHSSKSLIPLTCRAYLALRAPAVRLEYLLNQFAWLRKRPQIAS